ncbi:MAG: VWA domain-containing protein, partial [Spirochaetes bacterium]|nr:VWA domain-containing protein [Spirochaetota bacterium]
MIIKFNRKYSFHSIYLVLFLILLISNIASAEVEINATLEDNLVILLDYSGSTVQFREAIESNAIYSIQNIESDTNVSVVVYGGFTKKSNLYPLDSLENRTTLENFVLNIKGKEGDVTKGYIYEGFDEARKILNNSTGTKQIALISDGNLDGKYNGKLDNDALIELVKEIKKNVTINLYQVLNSSESLTLKKKSLREPYKDFSDQLSTEVMILNPDEKIRFLKVKFNTTIVSVSSEVVDSSQAESSNDVNITSEGDEYLNEFSNDGEIKNVSIMYYGQKGSLLYRIHFYSYCNQNDCIIVPFDIGKIKFYKDKVILQDIFRSKDTIELVKSGNINELAYTFSSSNIICEYYDINVFKKEGMNLGGEVAPSVAPKSAKIIKQLKTAKMISKINYGALVASAYCLPSNNDEILYKIAEGAIYTQNLKVGYAYNGIVKDFQNYNKEIVERITERKNSSWNLFYILNNPLYDKQLPLINNNYVHLV